MTLITSCRQNNYTGRSERDGSIARRCGIRDNGYLVGSVIVALAVGAGGGMWLKTHLDAQAVAKVAREQKQEQPPKSKYDVGPVDVQEMLELVNKERVKVGVAPLKIDERLNASA